MIDPEDYYTSESKKNEEEFFEEIKNGKDPQKAEKDYLKKSRKTRAKYEKYFKNSLKKNPWEEKKKEEKKEEKKKFIVEKISLEETSYERFKESLEKRRFIEGRKWSRIFHTEFFDFFRYIFFRIKYMLKNLSQTNRIFKDNLSKEWSKFKQKSKERFNKIKDFLKSIKEKMHGKGNKNKKKGKKDKSKKGSNEESDNKEK